MKTIVLVAAGLIALLGCDVLPGGRATSGGAAPPGGGVSNTAMTRPQHEMFFPIAAGAHSATDCNSCHGGFSSFKQFTCISCHDHAQTATDTSHAGVSGYKYDSKSCLGCHPSGMATALSRADHSSQFFPIDPGKSHGNAQCSDCHTNASDKKQFTCLTCHEHAQDVLAPKHVGVTDYKWDSQACLSCHPQSSVPELPRMAHTLFPIDVGTKHANTQCGDCHTNPSDKSQFTCIGCHDHAEPVTTPKHTKVAGYTYDSPSCYRCHSNGAAVFDHATLPAPPNCLGCHQAALAVAITTPASMHVANMFPTTCESCHKSFTAWGPGTPMAHAAIGGTASKCETCHTGNLSKAVTSPASMHVANMFPTACATCHTSFTAWGPKTPMQHAAVGGTKSKCETCHLSTFMTATTPFNHITQKVSASVCNTCHTDFTTWNKFVHNNNCYNGTTLRGHQGATCAQCHTVPTDYKQSSCTACHQNRGTNCND